VGFSNKTQLVVRMVSLRMKTPAATKEGLMEMVGKTKFHSLQGSSKLTRVELLLLLFAAVAISGEHIPNRL